MLTRLETLKAIRDTIDEQEFREELRAIDFEFKKINHYETLIEIDEDPEVIDNMMFVVDSKIEEASNYYLEKLKEGGFLWLKKSFTTNIIMMSIMKKEKIDN